MLAAAPERIPVTRWPGAAVRRYRGRLHAEHEPAPAPPWQAGSWSPGTEFSLGGHGYLALLPTTGDGLSRTRLPGLLTVTARPPGASFRPAGGAHRRELRKWLQEQGVLPWRRAALPYICAGDEIVAVGDLACGGALAAAPGEPAWRVVWHGRPTLTESEALAGAHRA
jgi:tRNA(Ile)-lysidine synthase